MASSKVEVLSDKSLLQSKRLISCKFEDGTEQKVEEGILYHFGFYRTMYVNLNMRELLDEQIGTMPLQTSPATFAKIRQWIENHNGLFSITIGVMELTRDYIWIEFTDLQKKFFEIPFEELTNLINATNYLEYDHLYKHSCQQLASLLKNAGDPARIRTLLNIADDLTNEEKANIESQNVWCKY